MIQKQIHENWKGLCRAVIRQAKKDMITPKTAYRPPLKSDIESAKNFFDCECGIFGDFLDIDSARIDKYLKNEITLGGFCNGS